MFWNIFFIIYFALGAASLYIHLQRLKKSSAPTVISTTEDLFIYVLISILIMCGGTFYFAWLCYETFIRQRLANHGSILKFGGRQ